MRTEVFPKMNRAFNESWDAVPGSELNAAPLALKRGGQDVCATHPLMQAVSDQTACALYKLSVFFSERVQLITLHVHHSKNVPMVIPYGNNNFCARRVKRGQISRIFMYIPDHDRLA